MPRLIEVDVLRERMYHDAFETDSDMQKWDSGCWIRYKMFENALEETPTVDAEPVRHGHWINNFDDLFPMESTVECSICGEKEWMMTIINHNYCPNCGAKMDEVRDE